jgi:serine/threonine-protein kinase HipA
MADFNACAKSTQMRRGRANKIIQEVIEAVKRWPEFAETAQVKPAWIPQIRIHHRLNIPKK